MTLEITYFIERCDDDKIRVSWNLNDKIMGIGNTEEEAIENLHNQWDEINKNTEEFLKVVNIEHPHITTQKYIFNSVIK